MSYPHELTLKTDAAYDGDRDHIRAVYAKTLDLLDTTFNPHGQEAVRAVLLNLHPATLDSIGDMIRFGQASDARLGRLIRTAVLGFYEERAELCAVTLAAADRVAA